jgi:CubicO group peptidase (beta-lactamase class C family)
MKYLLALILFSFLIVNCNQTETNGSLFSSKKHDPPAATDSVKYKAEIYRIDTLFQKLYLSDAFIGNVLVARGSTIIYKKSFGYGIKETKKLHTDSSLFQLASVSKVITGIAILILKEQGKLDLDKPVSEILTGFPYEGVTVRQLLSHRSGLPNYIYFCSDMLPDKPDLITGQDMLDAMIRNKPKAWLKPNTQFNYCNTNYALLALIIEKTSGKTYSEFLSDEIFIPLGMKHTFTQQNVDFKGANITLGYTIKYQQVAKDRYDGVLGDKGIYTTTYDLFLLSNALYQNKILTKETQDLAYTPNSPEKKLSNYGLGWRMNMNAPSKEVFHNGWWHGYRTSFHRRLKDSLTIVVLSNRLNRSVYSTWRIYGAIDGPLVAGAAPAPEEE